MEEHGLLPLDQTSSDDELPEIPPPPAAANAAAPQRGRQAPAPQRVRQAAAPQQAQGDATSPCVTLGYCIVCTVAPATTVIYGCGHSNFCLNYIL